ncbi:holin-associated N-acetylmuramidase [Rubellimicrobium roseum]|uniref:Peptidoglycan-binding protein n=1 Tax=Rubellimicrobium roseum TaxID=687525 RepID=A0A5C4NJS5_9RHOB|nr:holin-associated N-acetylmuramidase [Rubellimicrobium roseum]TNC73346.1 peptidoglycan-binding protein [Rubellimicrobium roseum]
MPSVHDIAREIVAREGGWSDHPGDPGGQTNHGVTLATLKRLRLDLDGDGRTTAADLRRLTPEQAADIFVQHYFLAPRLHELPPALQPGVFDMQVNAGRQAVRLLQRMLNDMGFPCAVDGVIGSRTAAAARAAAQAAPNHIACAYGIARRNYYYAVGDRRPVSRAFCRRRDGGKGGWITRAESFIHPRYHFTEAEHRERTKAWR